MGADQKLTAGSAPGGRLGDASSYSTVPTSAGAGSGPGRAPQLGHAGEANTHSHLGQYYHILGARQLIKSVVQSCRKCNMQREKAFNSPEPMLPSFRTKAETHVPLRTPASTTENRSNKVYGLLITYAVTRAAHLEAVTSLAAKQCLNALTRFFARQGVLAEIHTDNATIFDAVKKALAKLAANVEELSNQAELAAHQIR
ncbi:hypothetical protein TYRP_017203 [Tyrophagus putrescentiae]|nr:hypothetical protein TYRP_017203 [Tyrophagus putrescentiae]